MVCVCSHEHFRAYWLRDAPTSLTFNNCTLCPLFCIYLRTNSNLCHLQHKLIGFYNRDEKCLLRGMDWVFKQSSLRYVCKGFMLHDVDSMVGDKLIATSRDGQNISG
jgi:hypothetical protein